MLVVTITIDTYDGQNLNHKEWEKLAKMVMEQVDALYVDDYANLKNKIMLLKKWRIN